MLSYACILNENCFCCTSYHGNGVVVYVFVVNGANLRIKMYSMQKWQRARYKLTRREVTQNILSCYFYRQSKFSHMCKFSHPNKTLLFIYTNMYLTLYIAEGFLYIGFTCVYNREKESEQVHWCTLSWV